MSAGTLFTSLIVSLKKNNYDYLKRLGSQRKKKWTNDCRTSRGADWNLVSPVHTCFWFLTIQEYELCMRLPLNFPAINVSISGRDFSFLKFFLMILVQCSVHDSSKQYITLYQKLNASSFHLNFFFRASQIINVKQPRHSFVPMLASIYQNLLEKGSSSN